MIKRLLLHGTRVISAGWCAECLLGGASRINHLACLYHNGMSNIKVNYHIRRVKSLLAYFKKRINLQCNH
jgi:hypothetical protein